MHPNSYLNGENKINLCLGIETFITIDYDEEEEDNTMMERLNMICLCLPLWLICCHSPTYSVLQPA